MRVVLLVVAALALVGCEADGRPSKLWGNAAEGFSRGMGTGTAPMPQQPVYQPLPQVAGQQAPVPTVQANFTGRSKQVQTVTGGMAWECTYNYGGRDFVLLFETFCPVTAAIR